jgi:TnpA family transposase
LKVTTASQLFKRLNSYSNQHPLYQALKEFGKIIKSRFILKY